VTRDWPRTLRYIVLVLVLLSAALFLFFIREMLKPLAWAAFMAYLLMPIANFVGGRTGWSRRASTNVIYFATLALVVGLISVLVPALFGQMEELAQAFKLISATVDHLLATPIVLGPLVIHPPTTFPGLENLLSQFTAPVLENALQLVEATSRSLAWLLLFVISMYYFLTQWDHLRDWLLGLAPAAYGEDAQRLYEQVKAVWVGYLWGQITLVFIVGFVCTFIWLAVGLPGALVIGPLTGLLTLIPDVGPLIGTIIATIVALLEGSTYLPISNFWFAALILAIYGVLMLIKNIWVRPRVMGRSVQMHEGLVFVSILGAVVYGGVLGALIVVPVLASLGVVGRYLRQRILGLEPFPGVELQPSAGSQDAPVATPEEEREEQKAEA
jgi:predicted PurR-regulated permease PerM